jgi:hypothetical protein
VKLNPLVRHRRAQTPRHHVPTRSITRQNKSFYDPILENPAIKEARDTIKASMIVISGCLDNQYSADVIFNGLFTANYCKYGTKGNLGIAIAICLERLASAILSAPQDHFQRRL